MFNRRLLAATAAFALIQGPAAWAAQEEESSEDSTPPSQITSGVPGAEPVEPAAEEPPASEAEAAPAEADSAAPAAVETPETLEPEDAAAQAEAVNPDAETDESAVETAAETTPAESVDNTENTAADTSAAGTTEAPAAETAAADAMATPVEADTAQLAPGMPARAANPLIQAAANYAQYRRDLNAVSDASIDSAAALDGIMDRLAAHTPGHLSDAFIGYSALLAAQNTDFIDQVKTVAEYFGRDQVVTGLLNDPAYVMTFKNTDGALQAALASANEEEADLLALGDAMKQKSYTLQHDDWALQVVDRSDRLDLIKAPAASPAPQDYLAALAEAGAISSADEAEAAAAKREAMAGVFEPLTIDTAPEPVMVAEQGSSSSEITPTAVGGAANDTMTDIQFDEDEARSTNAIMTLAALEALGVGATQPEAMTRVMNKVRTQSCLEWAHTQLQVCVAAGHFKYEDAFCIAEHQLNQVAQCFGAVTAN